MTSLSLTESSIPDLHGKIAFVTGGSSGIGFATVQILGNHGAKCYILDLEPPRDGLLPSGATFVRADTNSWEDLKAAFGLVHTVDIAVANAGVSESENFLEDEFGEDGELTEPKYGPLGVNYRGVLNFIKLAVSKMKAVSVGGSIVITSSATAYAPEQSLPVYSATKLALIGLVRSLRSTLILDNISINAVAPAATITKLLPQNLAEPLMAAGLPVSSADMVGLAIVYSATAYQARRVEDYGKDTTAGGAGKWNGRVILTLGAAYTEIEESISRLRPQWFGAENARLTRAQQAATDFRDLAGGGGKD